MHRTKPQRLDGSIDRTLRNCLLCCAMAGLSAACGGGSEDPTTFDGFIAAANQARQTTLRLAAADTSCTSNSDCTELRFAGICPGNDSAALSLRSPTASEALAALREQQRLMAAAIKLDVRPVPPCLAPTPFAPACVQLQCSLVIQR
jgi:hypothetical protein